MYRGIQGGDGGGWSTDYPDADLNFSTRLGELTKTPISRNKRTGEPNHLVVPITDPLFFRCPFVMMFEVGNFYIDDNEARILREYLRKGGFLWVDDFWGTYAWNIWESQIRKALPAGEYPIVDLPLEHPLFHQFFEVTRKAQIPSINHWMAYRDTSERFADSRPVNIRGISDDRGRLMVLMTHNTDFGDSWEREGLSHEYFVNFSVDGYAVRHQYAHLRDDALTLSLKSKSEGTESDFRLQTSSTSTPARSAFAAAMILACSGEGTSS